MNMQEWRAEMGLTQHQAAEALGVSRSLIVMIETGQRRLDRRTEYAMRWIAHVRDQQPAAGDAALTADERRRVRELLARVAPTPAPAPTMLPPVRPAARPAMAPEARPAMPAIPLSAVDDASMHERMARKIAELAALDDDE